jgi:hypothetical protein
VYLLAFSENSIVIKANRDLVWDVITDMESWPNWGINERNRVVYHTVLERENNVIVCEEIEQTLGIFKTKHIDRYEMLAKDRLEEKILEGDLSGGFLMTLSDHHDGIKVFVRTEIKPKKFLLRIIDILFGDRILHQFWEDLLQQLTSYVQDKKFQ